MLFRSEAGPLPEELDWVRDIYLVIPLIYDIRRYALLKTK